jgi:hypothetical protein
MNSEVSSLKKGYLYILQFYPLKMMPYGALTSLFLQFIDIHSLF